MAIDRRRFLKHGVGAFLLAGPFAKAAQESCPAHWLGCRRNAAGMYTACAIAGDGRIVSESVLPGRGHAVSHHPRRPEAVVFARRPGSFLLAFDTGSGAEIARVDTPADRHFYGHGVFDREGRLLYATENDFETGTGVVGVYDAADGYRRLGEFPSHGVGPHELRFLADGSTLAIANGGIRTHPDLGRARLNLEDMQANLAYVDAAGGGLIDTWRLPPELHQLSIRHIDLNADDQICLVMQYQGPADRHPPLVAFHRGEDALQLRTAPNRLHTAMRNYCGSVAVEAGGRVCAVTSPRGGLVTLWSMADGRFLGSSLLRDCGGVAAGALPGGFLVSSGEGRIVSLNACNGQWQQDRVVEHTGTNWDNHLTPVTLF